MQQTKENHMLNNAIEITDKDIQIVLADHGITSTPAIIQRAQNLIEPLAYSFTPSP